MASELEKIIVTMEANNAALLKKIDQNTKSLKKFEGSTKNSLSAVDKAFNKTGNVAAASAKKVGRSFKGAAGQLGFQIQDVAVQLQAGQNAMLIFSQQGSQIASIFGPGGAVIGALIAVTSALAGALIPQLLNTKNVAEQLDEIFKSLNETLKKSENGVFEYTEAFKQLAKESKSVALVRIKREEVRAVEGAKIAVEGLRKELGIISGFNNQFGIPIQDLGELIRILNSPIKSKEDLFKAQEILNKITLSGKAASPELIKLSDDTNRAIQRIRDLDKALDKLNNTSQELDFQSIEDISKSAKRQVSAIKRMVSASSDELNTFIKILKEKEKAEQAFNKSVQSALSRAFPDQSRINALKEQILTLNIAIEEAFNAGDTERVRQYSAAVAELEGQITKINQSSLNDALNQAFPDESRISDLQDKIATLKLAIDSAIDSGDVEAAERYREAVSKISEQIDNLDPMRRKIKELGADLDDTLTDGIANAIAGVKDWEKQFLASIAKILIKAAALKFIGASGTEGAGSAILQSVFSFDGGGFTGSGPRAGGIDGKGGFPAILHPNETVVDHSRGGSIGNSINITVQANEPTQFIKAQRRIAYEANLALGRLS